MDALKITGADAKTFLQRQASSNDGYMAFLTPHAKVIALAYFQEPYLFSENPELLKSHLEKFIIVEDVEIMSLRGNEVTEAIQKLPELSFEQFNPDDTIIKLDKSIPGTLEKYIDFNKGCFPGQEPLSKFKNIGERKRHERSQKHLDEALEIFAQSKDHSELDPAIELLRKSLAENPKNEDAMESLGVMLAKQEKFDEAIRIMHQLELLNPSNQMAQMNLSIFYMKIGDKERAEEHKAKGTVLQFDQALK